MTYKFTFTGKGKREVVELEMEHDLINFQTYHRQNPSRFLHLSDDGSGGVRVLHE